MEELGLKTFKEWYEFNKACLKHDTIFIQIYGIYSSKTKQFSELILDGEVSSLKWLIKNFGDYYVGCFGSHTLDLGYKNILKLCLLIPDVEVK